MTERSLLPCYFKVVLGRFDHKRLEEAHRLVREARRIGSTMPLPSSGSTCLPLVAVRTAVLAALAQLSGKRKSGVTGAGVEDGEGC